MSKTQTQTPATISKKKTVKPTHTPGLTVDLAGVSIPAQLVRAEQMPEQPSPKDRAVPALKGEQRTALHDQIKECGRVITPIVVDQHGVIVDGFARFEIARELGIPIPWTVVECTAEDRNTLSRALNLARRHLNEAERRSLITAELTEDVASGETRRAINVIAKQLGVAHGTVNTIAQDLIARGEIPPILESIGVDGKVRKAHKPHKPRAKKSKEETPTDSKVKEDDGRGVPVTDGGTLEFTPSIVPLIEDQAIEDQAIEDQADNVIDDGGRVLDRPGYDWRDSAREQGREPNRNPNDPLRLSDNLLDLLWCLGLQETSLYHAIEKGEPVRVTAIESVLATHPARICGINYGMPVK